MADLDTTHLKDLVLSYMARDEKDLTPYEDAMLNEMIRTMADFDARFVQYPLLCAGMIAWYMQHGFTIPRNELKLCLETLNTADQLKGNR